MEKTAEDGSIQKVDLGMVGEVMGVKLTYWKCLPTVISFQ